MRDPYDRLVMYAWCAFVCALIAAVAQLVLLGARIIEVLSS